MRAETASAREALQWRIAVCVLWLSIGLYLFSLSGIAVCLDPGECQRGWVALAFGWVGVSRVEDLAWFANPLLIFGWLLAPSGARFLSGPFCVAALLISGAYLFATKVVGPGEAASVRPIW